MHCHGSISTTTPLLVNSLRRSLQPIRRPLPTRATTSRQAIKSLQCAPRPLSTTTVHLTKMSPKSTEVTHRLQRLRRSDRHRMRQSEDSFSFKGTLAKARAPSSRDSTQCLSKASLQLGSFQQEGDDPKLHNGKSSGLVETTC